MGGTGNVPTLSKNISSRIYIIKNNHSNTNGRVEIASSNTTSVSQEYILPSSIGSVNQVLKIGSVDSNNSNKLTLVWDTGGGGSSTNATTIDIANETSDSECFIVFSNNATGDVALKTNNNIKFNSNNGILTTTTFNGSLTGNATTATNLNSVQSIAKGGTNATSAYAARTALGVDAAGTDNSTNVMLSSVAGNYLTLDEDNQILTAGVVPISLGGTGATSASVARDSTHLNVQKDVGFVNGDKIKLNSIEEDANVTDTANVTAAGALMNTDNSKKIVDDIIIGEDDNDLIVVNSNIETNGYLKKAPRFTPVTKLNSELESFTFVEVNSNTVLGDIDIEHLDGDTHIDTKVKIDNIKDMTNILVLFKTGISYSTENMFVAILLIKRLYNSSGSVFTGVGGDDGSGNIIVGTASDGNSNTTDAFFDGSIGYSWSRATYSGSITYGSGQLRAEDDVLKNLNGQFLDTNITEGVDDVVGVSYHMAFKPLHAYNNILNINSPRDTSNVDTGPDRSNVATIISLIPY